MKLELTAPIIGDKGKLLFSVIMIDKDDSEDTTVAFWRADSEDQLKEMFIADQTSDADSSYDDFLVNQIEEDWGFYILVNQIGIYK